MIGANAMHQYTKGQMVQIQIPQKMRDEKDIVSRYLVGTITVPDSPSGKSFQALVRPAYGAAVDCHRCGVELKDDDCRKVGYGRDCAKKLGVAFPRHKNLTDAEVAAIRGQIERIEPKLLWFPKWKEVVATVQSQPETTGGHLVDSSRAAAPTVSTTVYHCRVCGDAIPAGLGLCADCVLYDWVPVIQRDVVSPTTPEVTVDSLLAIMRQRMPGYEERKAQVDALRAAERVLRGESESPHLIAELEPGTGKTFVNLLSHLAASAVNREPMILAPPTKALQVQYRKDVDFLQANLGDVRPFVAAEIKGRRNYLCLSLYNDRLEELRQTGEVSFRTAEAARQFTRDVVPWAQLTQTGDIEDAPFVWETGTRLDLTTSRDGCTGKQCRFFDDCWANRALKRGGRADVVITNLRLLIEHARIYLETGGHAGVIPLGIIPRAGDVDDDPEPEIDHMTVLPRIAIDEAQWLEDVARDALGVEITRGTIQAMITRIEHFTVHHKTVTRARKAAKQGILTPEDQADAEALLRSAETWREMLSMFGKVADGAFAAWETRLATQKKSAMHLGDEADVGGPLLKALDVMRRYIADSQPRWIEAGEEPMWIKLRKQITTLLREAEQVILPGDPDVIVRWMKLEKDEETQREHLTLCANLISVADPLREMLWEQFPHVIAVSATLAGPDGLDHWRRRVGAPSTDEMIARAPFDYSKSLLYLPSNAKQLDPRGDARNPNTVRGRDYLQGFVETTAQLLNASKGGALLLFSSKRAMDAAYKGARELTLANQEGDVVLPEVRGLADQFERSYALMRQGQFPLKEIVAKMKADPCTIALGLKSFWEGIDIPGLHLRLVVIDSFPFTPPDDPVWDAMCAAEDRRMGREMAWFNSLGVPMATIAVKQAAGRLVRRATDLGVVALLDGRATITSYGPRILKALPAFTVTRSIHDAAKLLMLLEQEARLAG
jgi:ATP-dependent DNA helicase DinG